MLVTYQDQLWLIGGFLPSATNMEAAASDKVLILDPAKGRWVRALRCIMRGPRARRWWWGTRSSLLAGGPAARSEAEVTQTEIFNGKSWHDAPAIPVPGDHLAGRDGWDLRVRHRRAQSQVLR